MRTSYIYLVYSIGTYYYVVVLRWIGVTTTLSTLTEMRYKLCTSP